MKWGYKFLIFVFVFGFVFGFVSSAYASCMQVNANGVTVVVNSITFGNSKDISYDLTITNNAGFSQTLTLAVKDCETGAADYIVGDAIDNGVSKSFQGSKTLNTSYYHDGDTVDFYVYRSSNVFYVYSTTIPAGWTEQNVFTPNVDFSNNTTCSNPLNVSLSASANFSLSSISNVVINGVSYNSSFNSSTYILSVPNVSLSSDGNYSMSFSYSGTNPVDGSSVSGSGSFSFSVPNCSGSQIFVNAYTVELSVVCNHSVLEGDYYNINITLYKDGVAVNSTDYSVSYTQTAKGGADTIFRHDFWGNVYQVGANPIDDIDDYDFTISVDGKTISVPAHDLTCGSSFTYNYDKDGKLTDKHKNDLISILKDIFNTIVDFFKFMALIFKMFVSFFALGISFLIATVKNFMPFVINVIQLTTVFIQALISPNSSGSLPFDFSSTFFGASVPHFLQLLHDSILNVESYVPQVIWWVLAVWAVISFALSGGRLRVNITDKGTGEIIK